MGLTQPKDALTKVAQAQPAANSRPQSLFINGKFLSGAKPFEEFKTVIDKELGRS